MHELKKIIFYFTDLIALYTTGGEFILVTASTVDFLLARNEALGADRGFADTAAKAFFVPLSRLVFHFLRA